jgi:hypothetical protein
MMRFLKQVSIAIAKLDSFIITKKGLLLTPIILAITTIVLLPIICAPTILFSFILIFYRTIRIRGNRFKTFGLSFIIPTRCATSALRMLEIHVLWSI